MHNGFITVNEEKMSKSLGNFFTVREILAKYDPEIVRFFMLSTHYRSPLDFDDTKLEMNKKSLTRLHNALDNMEALLKNTTFVAGADNSSGTTIDIAGLDAAVQKAETDFREAMDDDFNTALATAALFDLAREGNAFGKSIETAGGSLPVQAKEALELLREKFINMGSVLGLFERRGINGSGESDLVEKLMNLVIEVRQEARAKKDWATADAIRNKLAEIGIVLEDTPQGVRWKQK